MRRYRRGYEVSVEGKSLYIGAVVHLDALYATCLEAVTARALDSCRASFQPRRSARVSQAKLVFADGGWMDRNDSVHVIYT
jgi:hypothetical protein